MSYLKVLEGGKELGDHIADGALEAAGCVKLSGNKTVAVQDDGANRSYAFNPYAASDGDLTTVIHGAGALVETDNYNGTPAAGNEIAWDESAKAFIVNGGSDFSLGEVIAVESGVMTFKSFI